MTEEYKQIECYGYCYFVSNMGNVKSSGKRGINPISGGFTRKDLVLKPNTTAWGYHKVCLQDHGKRKHVFVHRLVAIAFIPNPQNKPQVNHIDGNKFNNKVDNLEWVTSSENEAHALTMGLKVRVGNKFQKIINQTT